MPTLGRRAKSVSDQLMIRSGNSADSGIGESFLFQSKTPKRAKSCVGRVFSMDEKINMYMIKKTLSSNRDGTIQNPNGSPRGSKNLIGGDMTNIERYFFD